MTISSRFHTTLLFSACFLLSNYLYENRYNILDPNITKGVEDDRKASGNLLESVKLDENLFRLGHTKARFSFKERFNIALIKQLQNEQKKSFSVSNRDELMPKVILLQYRGIFYRENAMLILQYK